MKRFFRTAVSVFMTVFSFSAATASETIVLKDYFLGKLEGDTTVYADSRIVRPKKLKNTGLEIWNAWVEANKVFMEEKLIPLVPLSDSISGKWTLPDFLEPAAVMNYYYGYKGEDKPEAGFPLFVYMHGSGPRDMEWATGLKLCSRFDDAPSVYFIPQIPNMGGYYRWWQLSKQYAWEKLFRLAMVSGDVDPDRIYMFGISEGGYGSQRLASYYADYLAGAGPMAGGEPLKNAPVENCANIAFSLRTGAEDSGFYRNFLSAVVKESFARMASEYPGLFTHKVELVPGMGHAIDYSPTTVWLKGHVRNPYPKRVLWENFDMDGRYRDGFYNIFVLKRPDEDKTGSRAFYDMKIDGNTINMNVSTVVWKTVKTDPHWGIELVFEKELVPAEDGSFILYLCDELVDLDREVTLVVNGKEYFRGKVKRLVENMVNSCCRFCDPRRVYPAAIEVDLQRL